MPVPAVLTGGSDQGGLQRSTAGSAAEGWAKDFFVYRPPSPALLLQRGLFGKLAGTPVGEKIHHWATG